MATDYSEIKEFFDLVRSDETVNKAFRSLVNSYMKMSFDERDTDLMVRRFKSWEDLDIADANLDRALQKNEKFQKFLDLAETTARTMARLALKGVI
jgi:hypothetical protein